MTLTSFVLLATTALLTVLASPAEYARQEAPSLSSSSSSSSHVSPSVSSSAAVASAPSPTSGLALQDAPAGIGGKMYTVTLVNSHSVAINTVHGTNQNASPAFYDDRGFIPQGGTSTYVLPTAYGGRVDVAPTGVPIADRTSLLEGCFDLESGLTEARITLDVSYVDGFTLPIVCRCGSEVVLGCNLDLLKVCPKELLIDPDTCKNPWRDTPGPPKENYFKDCEEMAYTWPGDDKATHDGIPGCEREIWCCVGIDCPPNPGQKLCPNKRGGYAHPCNEPE